MEIQFPVLVIFAAIFCSIFWGFGFLIGDVAKKKSCYTPNNNYLRHADEAIREKLFSAIGADHISDNLKFLASTLHRAGTPESLNVADWIANKYRSFGHIEVYQPEYDVLLSYPNNTNPNSVQLYDGTSWIEVSNGTSHYYGGEVNPLMCELILKKVLFWAGNDKIVITQKLEELETWGLDQSIEN